MKEVLLWLMSIIMIMAPVQQFQKYTLEQTETQIGDLMMRDLTAEEMEAIETIQELMDEIFINTWEFME